VAVVDVETTGLSPSYGDRVVEIAVLRSDGRSETAFQSLVNPRRAISPGASAVHGITQAMVDSAPLFGEVADRIWPFLDGAVLVAHNAPFDLSFLNAERAYLGLQPLDNRVIDTLALARRYFSFPRNGLGPIAGSLGIPAPVQHRAMADVLITLKVLERFAGELKSLGMASLDSLSIPSPSPVDRDGPAPLPPPIAEALAAGGRLSIRYLSAQQDETVREVEPLEIIPQGDYLYLRAFCHLRGDERTFRLDRIVEMLPVHS
jgi:DNA polymerase-3 subunit epsilon